MAFGFFIVSLSNVVMAFGMFAIGHLHRRGLDREKKLCVHIDSLLATIETYKLAVEDYKRAIATLTPHPTESEVPK